MPLYDIDCAGDNHSITSDARSSFSSLIARDVASLSVFEDCANDMIDYGRIRKFNVNTETWDRVDVRDINGEVSTPFGKIFVRYGRFESINDEPAIRLDIFNGNAHVWMRNGKLFREGDRCVIKDNTREIWAKGVYFGKSTINHRVGLPSIVYRGCDYKEWWENGEFLRSDGTYYFMC